MIGTGISLVLEDAIYAASTVLAVSGIYSVFMFYRYSIGNEPLTTSLIGLVITILGLVSFLYVR